jgi:hypothetical protein
MLHPADFLFKLGVTILMASLSFYCSVSVPRALRSSDLSRSRLPTHHPPKKVKGLSYGMNVSRSIKDYAAAAILVNPLFLFGVLKKNKQHFIAITYETAEGAVPFESKQRTISTQGCSVPRVA